MAKSKSDIPLGGAEQNMSREELAAVAKAVAALSPEDRDLLAAVQESPFRLTTAEQFLEFEKNVDCFVQMCIRDSFIIGGLIGGFVLVWRLLVAAWYVPLTIYRLIVGY